MDFLKGSYPIDEDLVENALQQLGLDSSSPSETLITALERHDRNLICLVLENASIKHDKMEDLTVINAINTLILLNEEEIVKDIFIHISYRRKEWILSSIASGHSNITKILLDEGRIPFKASYIIHAVNYGNHKALLLLLNDERCHSGHIREKLVRKAICEKYIEIVRVFVNHYKTDERIKHRHANAIKSLLDK